MVAICPCPSVGGHLSNPLNPAPKKDSLIVWEVAAVALAVCACAATGCAALITIDALSDFVRSATLVAVIVTTVSRVTFGPRYRPLAEIVPADAAQVTPTFGVFLINAVNWTVSEDVSMAVSGVSLTTTPVLEF